MFSSKRTLLFASEKFSNVSLHSGARTAEKCTSIIKECLIIDAINAVDELREDIRQDGLLSHHVENFARLDTIKSALMGSERTATANRLWNPELDLAAVLDRVRRLERFAVTIDCRSEVWKDIAADVKAGK